MPSEQKLKLPGARRDIGAAAEALRRSEDAEALKGLKAEVSRIEQTLGQIGTDLESVTLEGLLQHNFSPARVNKWTASLRPPDDAAARLNYYDELLSGWDFRIGLLAFTVAVLTALPKVLPRQAIRLRRRLHQPPARRARHPHGARRHRHSLRLVPRRARVESGPHAGRL